MEENEVNEVAAREARSPANFQQPEAVNVKPTSTDSDFDPATSGLSADVESQFNEGTIRTLDGELAGDEMEQDAINYQILLGKIDRLLERLKLDA